MTNTNNAEALREPDGAHGANILNGQGGASSAALLSLLAAEFPRSQVSWRAQTLSKDGDKALALAYIDARDVMQRLDDVCGAGSWQNRYSHADKKTICEIGVKIEGEWVWKANGAGDSDIEAEKGALSDAFKRAAVLWGIGRYLYDIESPWVPCDSYEKNGKKYWSKWKGDPWASVRGIKPEKKESGEKKEPEKPVLTVEQRVTKAREAITGCTTSEKLTKITSSGNYRKLLEDTDGTQAKDDLMNFVTQRFGELMPPDISTNQITAA